MSTIETHNEVIMNTPERMGYACINMQLSQPKNFGPDSKAQKVFTNRTMIRRTFDQKGVDYASSLALQNCIDLHQILKWNHKNGFDFFRISSNLFPWASEYEFEDLKDYESIVEWLDKCGQYALATNQRLTTHPGPFNKLASPHERVVKNTIKDLEIHGWMMDRLGMPRTSWAKINIHVGAAYNDKPMATSNFCKNFDKLNDSVKSRLTVENDDKKSLYTTHELYDTIYKRIGTPLVFDYHHHECHSDGASESEALKLAASTWRDITPVVHYSESRAKEYSDDSIKIQAHSDYIYKPINTYGVKVHCMVEAKHKELAVSKWRGKHQII